MTKNTAKTTVALRFETFTAHIDKDVYKAALKQAAAEGIRVDQFICRAVTYKLMDSDQ